MMRATDIEPDEPSSIRTFKTVAALQEEIQKVIPITQLPTMEDEDTAELRNPFPSPPSHYTKYTSHNLSLLSLLKGRAGDIPEPNQRDILHDQSDVPDWPLTQLEKPRVDWILEDSDAYYDVFGDRWLVKEKILSLEESGGNQLYPSDPTTDRRPALQSILRSMLVTYSALMGSILVPPPIDPTVPPEWQRHVEWITVLSQNLMAAANDLRPVQAREHLESMMRRQLELRREETKAIHQKCDVISAKLADLRGGMKLMLEATQPQQKNLDESMINVVKISSEVPHNDMLNWAEQV